MSEPYCSGRKLKTDSQPTLRSVESIFVIDGLRPTAGPSVTTAPFRKCSKSEMLVSTSRLASPDRYSKMMTPRALSKELKLEAAEIARSGSLRERRPLIRLSSQTNHRIYGAQGEMVFLLGFAIAVGH